MVEKMVFRRKDFLFQHMHASGTPELFQVVRVAKVHIDVHLTRMGY